MQTYHEYVGNLHMHTTYSDGHGSHADLAEAAVAAGLDFIVVTDHNVRVTGVEGYYGPRPGERVLLLTGEEVHDMRRDPQANHMLIFEIDDELTPLAGNPQDLLDAVGEKGGLAFLAHPHDRPAPIFGEGEYPWVDWAISGYTGIELWNYMSEFKLYLTGWREAVQAAFNPDRVITGPQPETLGLWDDLLKKGLRVVAIGNSDAHAFPYSLGPITKVIFPYEHLFRSVNTHVLAKHALNHDIDHDRAVIFTPLKNGNAFVGYDYPASTRGFRFSAQGHNTSAIMGDRIRIGDGITLQIACPAVCEIRLLKDGNVVETELGTNKTYIARKPGVYRVEAYIEYRGKLRGWIFSNPIYVTK